MAANTRIAWRQIQTGDTLDVVSGHAIASTNQTLINASGVININLTGSSGALNSHINSLSGYSNVTFPQLTMTGFAITGGPIQITGVGSTVTLMSGNNVLISGISTGNFVTTAMSGTFAPTGSTGVFITSGSLPFFQVTGSPNISGVIVFSGISGIRSVRTNPQNIAYMLDGVLSGVSATGSANVGGAIVLSGASGIKITLTNPSNFAVSTDNILTGLNTSGSANFYGAVSISGIGGAQVILSGGFPTGFILISGSASNAGVGNVTGVGVQGATVLSTGGFIFSGLSGITITSGSPVLNNFGISIGVQAVTGFGLSGDILQTGAIYISGSGTTIQRDGNIFLISGGQVGPTGPTGPAGATGPSSNAFFGISFYTDFVYTGLNIGESIVPANIAYTGYAISCVQSGLGPDTAGQNVPMTGRIYNVTTGNSKTVLTQFTFDSGEIFQQSGGANVTINGWSRLGYDITRSLSGIQGFTLSIFGSGL